MANDFYNASGAPATSANLTSATMRAEFTAIDDAFDKLPTMTANGDGCIFVNSAGTALVAKTAAQARTLLGLVIGTDVQAYDADLAAIAALSSAANKMPYSTGAQTWALTDLTAAGRALLDDADAAAQRTTLDAARLGGANTFVGTQTIPTIALTGGQIAFPATAVPSADANTLDDYEEGTFTPTIAAGSGTITSTDSVSGVYTKIGRMVTVAMSARVTNAGTGSGVLTFGNLPFAGINNFFAGVGREIQVNGKTGAAYFAGSTTAVNLLVADGTTPIALNAYWVVNITYWA